jgi:hypothetical protein
VIVVGRSELSCASIFFAMLEKFRLSQDGFCNALKLEGEGRLVGQSLLIFESDWEDDRNGLVGNL